MRANSWPLWLWALAALAASAGWAYWGAHWSETAWDFTMFYVAAHVPIESVHDQPVFQETGRGLLAGTGVTYIPPYVRPSVFVLALRWMRGMPYWHAYLIWAGLQYAAYAAALWVLARQFRVPVVGFYPWLLLFPAFFGMITGQDSIGVMLILCLGAAALTAGREAMGGALLSLTLYKFNLFLLLPVYLVLKKRYRALAAYAASGAVLAGASAWLEPPSTYLGLLPRIEEFTIGFSAATMPGLRGLLSALGLGAAYLPAAIALGGFLLFRSRRMEFTPGFGLAVLACYLCAYHVTWYDGAVLALPLGLAAGHGNPALRRLAAAVMIIPFWNVFPAFITVVLLAFSMLYASPDRHLPPPSAGSSKSGT